MGNYRFKRESKCLKSRGETLRTQILRQQKALCVFMKVKKLSETKSQVMIKKHCNKELPSPYTEPLLAPATRKSLTCSITSGLNSQTNFKPLERNTRSHTNAPASKTS